MASSPEITIREQMTASGDIAAMTWETWRAELLRLASEEGIRGDDEWADAFRGYYDDAYSPADALGEDGSYG